MPLSWNEIKTRVLAFSREWAGEKSERAEAQSFWNDFFHVFGIGRRRLRFSKSRSSSCVPAKKYATAASTRSGKVCC
jgi:hypothetical protein